MYLANKDFFDNAYKAVSEARLIVEEAQRQQQITDHLLDRVSDADSRAKSAVKSGNEILNSARNTLDTLKNFNSIVAKHRDEAQEHIKRIPRIEENIGTVAQKSNAVKELINDAEFKARQSKETAENALRIAKQAKTVCTRHLLAFLLLLYVTSTCTYVFSINIHKRRTECQVQSYCHTLRTTIY